MAAMFLFNDLMPLGGEFKVKAIDFVGRGVQLYDHQRKESADRVKEIVDEQLKYGRLFFATSFVLVHIDGVHKFCDGQHRLSALRQLISHPDMPKLEVRVIVHVCGVDRSLAERIYLQCNNQYMHNGAIDRHTNQLFKPDISALARKVVDEMSRLFPKQVGTQFPNFDLNALEGELNSSGLLERKSPEEIVTLILKENADYMNVIYHTNPSKYFRCNEKGGLYLPAKVAACRWIRDIAQKY